VSRLLVVGDALLDRDVEGFSERLCPDAPVPVLEGAEGHARPGGAGLAAALAALEGQPVTLIAALGADQAGRELARALLACGVDLVELSLSGPTPEKVRFLDRGRPLMRLDRGGADGSEGLAVDGATPALKAALAEAGAILVSDYGRGVAAAAEVRQALASRRQGVPLVWDPHPRGPMPIAGTELATPNLDEAERIASAAPRPAPGPPANGKASPQALARALAVRWRAGAVCITCGEQGAALGTAAGRTLSWSVKPAAGDPCGAGDRFAVSAARALADGAEPADASGAAVRDAARYVAESGGRRVAAAAAKAAEPGLEERLATASNGSLDAGTAGALEVAARTRAGGGTVVASGGCFDLLHLGHVRSLEAARALGDCLVVLLNGDRSVRALKGRDRPLVGEEERAETLRALACVDEVMIFEEPDPSAALSLLRPDVWAKGGDYQVDELPESKAIATWGGRIAILPFLEGRSTTKLIEEANGRVRD
jgi:rfaE bifunctional protein nucleotidyltransferase chain/domain/rfaE bifunctional protein kinase chain/domain